MDIAGAITLQNPVDFAMLSQPLQMHSNGCQIDFILLQGLTAATMQLDGPLLETDKQARLGLTQSSKHLALVQHQNELTPQSKRLTVAAPRMTTSGFAEPSCNTQEKISLLFRLTTYKMLSQQI